LLADEVIDTHKIGAIDIEIHVCCLVGRFGAAEKTASGISPVANAVALISY